MGECSLFNSWRSSSDYVSYRHVVAHAAVIAQPSAAAQSTVPDVPDATTKAAAIAAFHIAIRSTSR
jgi:hypothetical protein